MTNIDKQQIDSVHIKSNMRRLGRIVIFSKTIHKFLKNLKRGQKEHCHLSGDKDNPVVLKKSNEIPSDSLQNPSDPDATYSGHKGQGYQVQVMETFCDDEKEKAHSLNLITHVDVEPAHISDANAIVPALESVEKRDLKPKELQADSLYGSDDNCESAEKEGVELIAPTMGSIDKEKVSLADFQFSSKGEIIACPRGNAPAKVKKRKRVSIGFIAAHCNILWEKPISYKMW